MSALLDTSRRIALDAPALRDLPPNAPARWALEELARALGERGAELGGAELGGASRGGGETLRIEPASETGEAGEGFALRREGGTVTVEAAGTRGLVYALTELADRVRMAPGEDLFDGPFPRQETPTARVRSMARLYCSPEEDHAWFHDRQGWRDYLTMLATHRFNRFSLTLGMGYNYPYHNPWITDVSFYFPYPFLLDVPGYGVDVAELRTEEREENLEALRFIGREAARRGLDFQLALWTQSYDFSDVPRANYTVRGITRENHAGYCRDAITQLLRAVPEITGLTFRVHVEGGIAEGDYGFWREAFAGVAAAGRPVEIDLHGKGLDETVLDLARQSGMPFAASPKYLAEHMGLPYHQSAIREKEYPPEQPRSAREQLSEGSRKFLRYSYGDLLRKDKDYKVLYRIWPGTQRLLLWGDPKLAGGYGRSSMFAGSDGVEWCEPLSFKGRMGTGMPGGRFGYRRQGLATRRDWEKYRYQYRVWGRLLFDPEAPRETWMRELRHECGEAADACETALAAASRVLPLVTLTHGPSASNNYYWPEIYTNLSLIESAGALAYRFDMTGPMRFGNAPTFDSELFATAREWAERLLAGEAEHRYTPFDVALWLDALADTAEGAVRAIDASRDGTRAPALRIRHDSAILAGIARYFAEKHRAAVHAELFVATRVTTLLEPAILHMRRAVAAWEGIAAVSRETYADDLTFGPQSWLRGSWHTRLPEIRAELLDLEALRGGGLTETRRPTAETERALAALDAWQPARALLDGPAGEADFRSGEPFAVSLQAEADAPPVLYYRHVNQAERWQSQLMRRENGAWHGEIPRDYTRSPFHLQYFVSLSQGGVAVLGPGLAADLSNEPYRTALQR
ncbi:hypothetical protein [Aureimonas jatrophae]|uniref:Glycosyl hydrolase family 20, domain 2 n=1 Tax=Aureimonas jatrophae TaxID=1166073 RepID=A0A1H0HS65_9HYPH|nr:hypothetical protein [Aureimonas jatrophae]MBB3950747.1 hypothetical protein [Aureimonas jatrophae]SDO22006.1 hypothetical protein SAMN05192530_104254 [Aureimonas jatrophae]